MKKPKIVRRYCPYCRKHTVHKVTANKKKSASSLSYGSKIRAKRRGKARGYGNLGRYSKPAVSNFKMTGAKQSKKTDFRFECKECKKTHMQKRGIRAKRTEFI
ncbi:50S ribosomal protein L44e [Candidatus Woesearchaeota archaeon]|nr:50S ribosomal protein L44e [Candidatus Woesearchaeota archaeon]